MADRNYFELLGLEFDPPDNIRKIKAAFEDWKKKLITEQNTTVDEQRLKEIKEELSMNDEIVNKFINDAKYRDKQARELKDNRVGILSEYLELMLDGAGGTLKVTQLQMKKVSEKLHLSLETVEKIYKLYRFVIKESRNKNSILTTLNDFFMSDDVMNDLRKLFWEFKTSKETDIHRYPWARVENINNLYELAAKIDKSRTKPNSYRYLSADELSNIFKIEAQQIADSIPAWRTIKAIVNIAESKVFNSNENRYRYDHSLSIESLNKFFTNWRIAPDILKRNSFFANSCIKRIESSLPSVENRYDLAVSLYNKVVGLLNDPYELADDPAETDFYVVCGNCQSVSQFRTLENAQQGECHVCGEKLFIDCPNPSCNKKIPASSEYCNHCGFSLTITCNNCHTKTRLHSHDSLSQLKCPACGEKFYIDCPNCHKKIPSSAERCPHCNFSVAAMKDDMDKFFADIIKADKILTSLEGIKITSDKLKSVEVLMNNLDKILAEAALLKPDDLQLKALETRRKAQERIKLEIWAEDKLLSLTNSHDKVVSNCIEVLHEMQKIGVKNYRPALERLSRIPPKKPVSISAVIKEPIPSKKPANSITNKISVNAKSVPQNDYEEVKLTCLVTWKPADDLEVKYQLVRKIGGIPLNNKDGEMMIDKTTKFEFEDKDIVTGLLYGYAVFAVRAGAVSESVTCTVVHYSDIEENKLIAKTDEGFCHFSWTLPSRNCLGVRILRTDNDGNLVPIADCVESPFVDRTVKSKKQYYYTLKCVYYSADERETINEQDVNYAFKFNKAGKVHRKYQYSEGLKVKLMPELPPTELQNINYRVVSNNVTFNWRSAGEFNVLFREVKDTQLNIDSLKKTGKSIELNRLDNIFGSNRVFAKVDSRNQTCTFKLTEEFCKIAVVSATQTLGVICDVITIANVTPCTINSDKTSIDGGKLKIILNPLPEKLIKIHYAITTKNMRGRLYMNKEDAQNNRMRSTSAEKYELDKMIIWNSPPQMELYLTVIGEYKMSDGSIFYSEPSTETINNRPKEEIIYWLEWGSSSKILGIGKKSPRAKNCKLIIETRAEYVPSLYLAYNKNGSANIELEDSSTVKIRGIASTETGFAGGHQEILLDNATWENINEGTVIKLLMEKKDSKHFDIRPARPESLRVPPK